MELRRVAVTLPCDGLSDFPTFLTATDAQAALHNWTAAWRPELIAASGALPAVWSAFDPPDGESAAGAVVLAPELGAMPDLTEWREALDQSANPPPLVLEGLAHRDAIIAALQAAGLDLSEAAGAFAPDFFALGYAYLQTELLTQSLQYASIIEPAELESRIVAAARAAVVGDEPRVNDSLRGAYDLLEQARDHSYPVELCLLDAVLVADTTLGARIRRELDEPTPKCFLMSADVAELIARAEDGVRARLAECEVVLAEPWDSGLDAMPPEPMRRRVLGGFRSLEEAFGAKNAWYAHARSSLPPRLPAVLQEAGCRAALLTPLDGGPAPGADQPRCLWRGIDGAAVQALAVPARDASSADTLLLHAQRLGDSLYSDRVTTVVMAAWAGCRHELYDDLRRVARRSNVLGEFVSLGQYFDDTEGAGAEARFDRAHAPAPRGAVALQESAVGLADAYAASLDGLVELAGEVSGQPRAHDGSTGSNAQRSSELARLVTPAPEGDSGLLIANAWSYARPVLHADAADAGAPCDLLQSRLIPLVPGAGFRVVAGRDSAAAAHDNAPARATPDGGVQSERLQARLDPETGGVRSIRPQARRGNRLSQKLVVLAARRHVETPAESRGVEVEVLVDAPDRGAVASRGRLVDASGRTLARFKQTLVLFANWNRAFLDIELDTTDCDAPMGPPRFASRIAWPDEECRLFRGVQWARVPADSRWITSQEYVHVELVGDSVTIADNSRGVRRRVGARMLDTLLPHPESGVSRHRLAIAIGERRPLRLALDLAAQQCPTAAATCSAAPAEGWLAHVDAANVTITAIERRPGEQPGMIVRVMETEGRAADARLRFARRPAAAHVRDDHDAGPSALELDGDAILVPLAAYEWRSVEVTW